MTKEKIEQLKEELIILIYETYKARGWEMHEYRPYIDVLDCFLPIDLIPYLDVVEDDNLKGAYLLMEKQIYKRINESELSKSKEEIREEEKNELAKELGISVSDGISMQFEAEKIMKKVAIKDRIKKRNELIESMKDEDGYYLLDRIANYFEIDEQELYDVFKDYCNSWTKADEEWTVIHKSNAFESIRLSKIYFIKNRIKGMKDICNFDSEWNIHSKDEDDQIYHLFNYIPAMVRTYNKAKVKGRKPIYKI